MKIEIKHKLTGKIIFECDAENMRFAVELAIKKEVNLSSADLSSADLGYANLSYANLSSANLGYANLSYANLSSANLSSADLGYANLSYADLRSANLSYADLRSANLSSADLRSANLRSADLGYANLSYANLSSANLRSANLGYAKKDFTGKLAVAKNEVQGLYKALLSGGIDGSAYTGECACFVGTIANLRREHHEKLSIDLLPDSNSETERLFLAIKEGDTPENNAVSAVVKEWMEEFMRENNITIPVKKVVWE